MKDYIKKFASINSADNYKIKDIPFVSSIIGYGNIVCNLPNKKLLVNDGSIEIGNDITLISFTIKRGADEEEFNFQAEEGMIWSDFITSEYNIDNFVVEYRGFHDDLSFVAINSNKSLYDNEISDSVKLSDEIKPITYWAWGPND